MNLDQVHHRVRYMICQDLHRINIQSLLECRDDLYICLGRLYVGLANVDLQSHDHIALLVLHTLLLQDRHGPLCCNDFLVADDRVFFILS